MRGGVPKNIIATCKIPILPQDYECSRMLSDIVRIKVTALFLHFFAATSVYMAYRHLIRNVKLKYYDRFCCEYSILLDFEGIVFHSEAGIITL